MAAAADATRLYFAEQNEPRRAVFVPRAQPGGAVRVRAGAVCGRGAPQLYRRHGQPLRGACELRLGNSAFRLAAGNTARFIGVCVPLLLCVSLLLAVAVRAAKDGGRIFKTTYLIPMAIPVASIVLLWQALFHRQGLVNAVLSALGAQPVDFMGTDAAFWVLIGTYVWKNAGYDMILWMAGLDGISDSLYEAARVDGAGAWQCFWRVTLPGLLPTLFMTAVLSLLNTFKVFREAYLVGGAYPHDSIYLLQHLFNNWFLDLDVGRLCAAAVLIAAVLLAAILLLQKLWGGEDAR